MRYVFSGIVVYTGALLLGLAFHNTVSQAFQVFGTVPTSTTSSNNTSNTTTQVQPSRMNLQ